ncbi:MAG: hypothetical protein BWY70_01023 [Bacteroidetes bacterium ADurb.Bin408]|nr:MAG: hypothetical protein BWY70_01023 [Bacteroidetes bacterium ADurb.Bin408]
MKNFILPLLSFLQSVIYCQLPCSQYLILDFSDPYCMTHVFIDTVNNPGNIWQIGLSNKNFVGQQYGPAIMTDTLIPYPANDTSAFIIKYLATGGDYYGCKFFTGSYAVQTDSLKDFGKIEFSPDNGLNWFDVINDTSLNTAIHWYTSKPKLTGNSGGWMHFEALLADMASHFNFQIDDTIAFRFSFISDSIFDNMGGIAYDNFCLADFIEGISEIRFKGVKSNIYPNPSNKDFTIEFNNPAALPFELAVYDIKSKLIFRRENITGNTIYIDNKSLTPGIYVYKITNAENKLRTWGKFTKL